MGRITSPDRAGRLRVRRCLAAALAAVARLGPKALSSRTDGWASFRASGSDASPVDGDVNTPILDDGSVAPVSPRGLEPPGSRSLSSERPLGRPYEVLDDASRAMRLAYADPPYPGKAHYYPEREDVDHQALVGRLACEFGDGWALSTSAAGLQDALALCPPGVRVCSWHRAVRPTRSRRAISAWEPLIVYGGRELPTARPQTVRDALSYGGRYRTFPGALIGMKPPQFAVWMFQLLGAQPGDQLVDLYPGSGAIGEAWRRYAGTPAAGGIACGVSATASRARRASLPPAIPTPPISGLVAASKRCVAAAAVACTARTTRAAPCAF